MNRYEDKDEVALLLEFHHHGYVEHICPDCGEMCEPTEIDNSKAYCEYCDELKNFPY